MKPHLCPKCNGERYIAQDRGFTTAGVNTRTCPTCNGAGVLWEPHSTQPYELVQSYQPSACVGICDVTNPAKDTLKEIQGIFARGSRPQ